MTPIDDPRQLGGDIAGPGGPSEHGTVAFDTRHAVLMDHVEIGKVDNPSEGRSFVGMKLDGRINGSTDRAGVLYLFDLDGAAAIITQLHGLAERAGWLDDLERLLDKRWRAMPHPTEETDESDM